MAGEMSLFGPDPGSVPVKPADDRAARLRILITVKAAPNPSETYGETVCVAGLRVDLESPGWVRLYPINFRELDSDQKFAKYDIVSLEARPNRSDPRAESWRPQMATLRKEGHLVGWPRRLGYVSDYIEGSMCGLLDGIRDHPPAKSLAAIHPRQVTGLDIEPHPGWTPGEQAKIDRYVSQLELPGMEKAPRTALEAPRFKGWYKYLCHAPACKGHRQGIYDWEFVALQRHLSGRSADAARTELRRRFLDQICAPDRDVVFFVGNQAKRQQTFMVLGAFYPRR